jgi:tryptophan 2,3-dioxygenase
MQEKTSSVHYINYLKLDKVLDAQHLISDAKGDAAHEEMLFIIIHQTYELWFKQILHELESVMEYFQKEELDEENIGLIVRRVERANKIMGVLVKQIEILETMTSLDFLDFRHHLSPASGFQSHQFRKIELILGLKIEKRHQFGGCPYHDQFEGKKKEQILNLEEENSLYILVEKWLERIPFLNMEEFNFTEKYEEAINSMLKKEIANISSSTLINEKDKKIRIHMIEENKKYFKRVLDKEEHEKAINDGETNLSYKATMSALLINLYRDEPILQLPYQLLRSIVELDHKIASWRFRHVQMVEKMLGQKIGTGGSSGQGYLKETVDRHKVFTDIANIATLMISRSYLPDLPKNVKENLGFNYKK